MNNLNWIIYKNVVFLVAYSHFHFQTEKKKTYTSIMMIVCRTGTGSFEFQTALHLHAWLYLQIYLCLSAPVLEPATSQLCLSPEEKIISCSSEGDEVEFMLFLDDNLLLQSTTKSTEKHSISKVTVTLHAQLMGKLACIVQNNVSRRQKIILITSCTGN